MKKTIRVEVQEKSYSNPYGAYTIRVNGSKMDVDQRCIERIDTLVAGEWSVEFDGGAVVLYGSYERGKVKHACEVCGKPINQYRTWCDPCLSKLSGIITGDVGV